MDDSEVQGGRDEAQDNVWPRSKPPPKLSLTLKQKKRAAKTGMTISLGSLILTGFIHFKGHKSLHTWSGIALLGFSIWHHRLNKRKSPK